MEHIDICQNGKTISKVVVGDGLKMDGDLGRCLKPYTHLFVVADSQVAQKSRVVKSLLRGFETGGMPVKQIQVSEAVKTMDTVLDICSWLLESGADRDALVLAIGAESLLTWQDLPLPYINVAYDMPMFQQHFLLRWMLLSVARQESIMRNIKTFSA